MISNKTPYRLPSKYELLVRKAFLLVKTKILANLGEAHHLSHLGIVADKSEVEKYHYLIYYLVNVRQQLDRFLQVKEIPCFTDEEWDAAMEYYSINCILKENVCSGYTNDIVNLILDYPRCSEGFTYEWVGDGVCTPIGEDTVISRTTLLKKIGSTLLDQFYIPEPSTLEEFNTIIGESSTQSFLNTRYIEDTEEVCCTVPVFTPPEITVVSVTANSFEVSWTSEATSFTLHLAEGTPDNIISTETVTTTSKVYENLSLSTTYYFTVIVENCAGETESTQVVNTLPYFVIINVCTELEGQLTFTGASLGTNTVTTYEGDFVFDFEDPSENFYQVTSVKANGVEIIDNVIFNVFESGVPMGGTISLLGITSDVVVEICGQLADFCSQINAEYTDNGTNDVITIT